MKLPFAWEHIVGVIALVLFVYGQFNGLLFAPPEKHMGDVARILYVHVPTAWNAFVVFGVAFIGALGYLISGRKGFDHLVEASLEVGTLLTALLIVQGSIFAKPTWGVWWAWDPRLTSSAVMLLTYIGVLVLRSLVADLERRAVWSAVATIMATVTLPVTYYSVNIWRSLHQLQTPASMVNDTMRQAWYLNALAVLLIAIWMTARRYRIASSDWTQRDAPPLPEVP